MNLYGIDVIQLHRKSIHLVTITLAQELNNKMSKVSKGLSLDISIIEKQNNRDNYASPFHLNSKAQFPSTKTISSILNLNTSNS